MILETCGDLWSNFLHRCCFCNRVEEDPEYIGDYDETEEDLLLPKKTITNIMVCLTCTGIPHPLVLLHCHYYQLWRRRIFRGVDCENCGAFHQYLGTDYYSVNLWNPIVCFSNQFALITFSFARSLTVSELSNCLPHEAGYVVVVSLSHFLLE
jgi:hypothetical protein